MSMRASARVHARTHNTSINKSLIFFFNGAGELAQWLRVLAVLEEDLVPQFLATTWLFPNSYTFTAPGDLIPSDLCRLLDACVHCT